MADGSGGGPDRGPHSRQTLLGMLKKYGAVYTARVGGAEVPFEGAQFYASELEREGVIERIAGAPDHLPDAEDLAFWQLRGVGSVAR